MMKINFNNEKVLLILQVLKEEGGNTLNTLIKLRESHSTIVSPRYVEEIWRLHKGPLRAPKSTAGASPLESSGLRPESTAKKESFLEQSNAEQEPPTPISASKQKAATVALREARKEIDELKYELGTLTSIYKSFKVDDYADLPGYIREATRVKPAPTGRNPSRGLLLLSDLHFGEVVKSKSVDGLNEYNSSIADARLRLVVQKFCHILTENLSGHSFERAVVCLGGDLMSGGIHDELVKTNDELELETVFRLSGLLIEQLGLISATFGGVDVYCCTGNHGRMTHKMQHKVRTETSWETIIYNIVKMHFDMTALDVQMHIATSPDISFNVYAHRYVLTHGDQFRGGDGIIGAIGPITRGTKRKRDLYSSTSKAFDTLLLGHFHQYLVAPTFTVNGSLVGFNEYAIANNFGYERPQQAVIINHAERGIVMQFALTADDGDTILSR